MTSQAEKSGFDDLLGAEQSPLDRSIAVTVFPNGAALKAEQRRISLRQLASELQGVSKARKEDLPWLKLAAFGDHRTDRGCLRHGDNVLSVDGVEADYDGEEVTLADAIGRCEAAGIAALGYSSPSHTPERPRWRLLAPLSRSVLPRERERLCARLNGAVGGILAPESFVLSQAYYFGRVTGAAELQIATADGRALDDAADLDAGALGADGRPYAPAAIIPRAEIDPDGDDDDWEYHPSADWDRIRDALAAIPVSDADDAATGGRELYIRIGQALHDGGRGSDEARSVWEAWSRGGDKFDARDFARDWRSFARRRSGATRVRIGTLYALAKERGWHAKAATPAIEGDAIDAIGSAPTDTKPAVVPTRLTFLSPTDCANSPTRGYVVKGMIAPRDLGCFFGPPGAGKSVLAPHIAYSVALGSAPFGMRTKGRRVLYVAAEDESGMRGRVSALKIRHGDAPEFVMVAGVSNLLVDGSPDLVALRAAVVDHRPALIFLDTLAMSFPGLEENSADGMGKVVAIGRGLTSHGAAVILIHHDTKAQGQTPRGHSLFNGALDMALYVSRDEEGVVRGRMTKNRNGSSDREFAFRIGSEWIADDEDGDPVTAPVAIELAPGAAPKKDKLTGAERAARKIFSDLAAFGSVVTEEAWRAACVDARTVSGSDEIKSRQTATRRAIEGLARKNMVILGDGMVRHPGSIVGAFDDD